MTQPVRAAARVQLSPSFGFDQAAAVVGDLARLGVSHLYTSPLAEAVPGSTHGYDVTDHQRVRAELGGTDALRRLWTTLAAHEMGHVVDLVPNHMGIRSPTNRWWRDVLAEGPRSRYARHFDIDWSTGPPELRGKVVLPFLDRPLRDAVHTGAFELGRDRWGAVVMRHHDDEWPASTESLLRAGVGLTRPALPPDGAADAALLAAIAGDPTRLAAFLADQHWRAVDWRTAATTLNWRRFFDVTDLAAVQVQRREVFDDVHRLLRHWLDEDPLASQVVQGVRVDHVDGLVDPESYLVALRDLIGPNRLLVVEKILAADEELPSTWPVDGTTGYEVLARIDEALTAPGADALVSAFGRAVGRHQSWEEVEDESRRFVLDALFGPEQRRAHAALAAGEPDDPGDPGDSGDPGDPGDPGEAALRERAVGLRVYRTYARPFTGTDAEHTDDDDAAVRFAQLTAPLAAKAVEDTAFYRFTACAWRNEVGGSPGRLVVTTASVHEAFARLGAWPGTLVGLTTHDTKRSADVRARLGRLSERPDLLPRLVAALPPADAEGAPEPSMRWLLAQVLVGAWPLAADRLAAYATKAMREAKTRTSWLDPDPSYEDAVQRWCRTVLDDPDAIHAVEEVVAELLVAGRAASLAQIVLGATAAGVPDVYQGDDLWNLALVDPDNRRPVDRRRRHELLDALVDGAGRAHPGAPTPAASWATGATDPDDDGLVKLATLRRLLHLRRGPGPVLAADAPYEPLPVSGPDAGAVLAYIRGDRLAVVVPRRFMDPVDATVALPAGAWSDAMGANAPVTGDVALRVLTAAFPVAVLVRD